MLYAPLEQFQILSLINLELTKFSDISFINAIPPYLIVFKNGIFFFYFCYIIKNRLKMQGKFYPRLLQRTIESIYSMIIQWMSSVILHDSEKYLPIISVLFYFILAMNIIGLVPYSFTATSHLIVTFILSFSVFIGINIIIFKKHKIQTFALFLPPSTPFFLALLLVPIEFISYLAKPVSLGMRLFINLMAGHSLLKIVVGFSWAITSSKSLTCLGAFIPIIILSMLFTLELGVALIQTYVFVILTCIYIQDGD